MSMYITSKLIVLSAVKYGDNDLIVSSYTQHRGFVSYMIKNAFSASKSSRVKRMYFQPLSQLAVVERYNPKRDLQYLKDIKPSYVYLTVQTNVYKGAIALFLSEVLTSVLREESENAALFTFLETAFQYLDTETRFANFHLLFLMRLTQYLGFKPNMQHADAPYFNLKSGYFQSTADTMYTIEGAQVALFKKLMTIRFEELHTIQLQAKTRITFLNSLLLYIELHIENFKAPKSLKVLTEIFR